MILYDSHCHLDFDAFDLDRDDVLARAHAAGVRALLVPGVEPAQWERAERLRDRGSERPGDTTPPSAGPLVERCGVELRFAVGIHPQAVDAEGRDATDRALDELDEWVDRLGAVAIGELGWDTKVGPASLARQKAVAAAQLQLAGRRNLPVILHVLGAHGAAIDELARCGPYPAGGIVHAYSGSAELVPRYLELGFHLSFGPSVTRANARRPVESAAATPLDRLLVETDGPDQYPAGRTSRRGEPADVLEVVGALARIRSEPAAEIAAASTASAQRLFG